MANGYDADLELLKEGVKALNNTEEEIRGHLRELDRLADEIQDNWIGSSKDEYVKLNETLDREINQLNTALSVIHHELGEVCERMGLQQEESKTSYTAIGGRL